MECQKLGEDLQQAYRAANKALEEIPAFEDIPKVDRQAITSLAEGTAAQAVNAFRNSRGAAGTTNPSQDSETCHEASTNGSKPSYNSHNGTRDQAEFGSSSNESSARAIEEGVNAAASKARSAAQQVATAAKKEASFIHALSCILPCVEDSRLATITETPGEHGSVWLIRLLGIP